jgi:subtilisin family serine protease
MLPMLRRTLLWSLLLALLMAVPANAASPDGRSTTDGEIAGPAQSHRLIVRLTTPSLAELAGSGAVERALLFDDEGLLDIDAPVARDHLARVAVEQADFAARLAKAVPGAQVSQYIDELGALQPLQTRVVLNAVTIEAGLDADLEALEQQVRRLAGVTGIDRDDRQDPNMYDSLKVINAADIWDHDNAGGVDSAGEGVRVASMDGGVHHAAAMFDGEGYEMPEGYPLGYRENTNGKIIVSRAYFRSWDPPAPDDDTSWPGAFGTSHGVHTAGTAAGNRIDVHYPGADELEEPETISGVAPRAYLMSYRVFYSSVNGIGSFYNAEGLQCLEDVVVDGAHVLNNSWGGGPGSLGGEFDSLDSALLNAWDAGVFVSMSNGNAGPNPGTGDHPTPKYINVAASTKGSYYTAVGFNVTAPEPVTDTLIGMPYGTAGFGPQIPVGELVGPFKYVPAITVDAANFEGCNPFPDGAFEGRAAVISRGVCPFTQKVVNAQNAGATFVVVHNDAARGDATMGMGGADDEVAIPSIFIGYTNGQRLIAWQTEHGDNAEFTLDNRYYKVSAWDEDEGAPTPDLIANFSSRGPGAGNTLKPEIAAPGVDIMSAGYAPATGEDRHLGYGQVGGTSMASPHVAGAAAMVRQIHPDWSNAAIKSALMSTSKYVDVFNQNGSPAQPLDMGAGRMDLSRAADPGVILSPPALSFGLVVTGTEQTMMVEVTNITEMAETYELTTEDTRGGFDAVTELAGVTLSESSITLAAGASAMLEVSWDTSATGYGDQQGYLVMTGDSHDAHMPLWIRVAHPPAEAEVLIMDNDGSTTNEDLADYTGVYTETLEAMGVAYDIYDVDAQDASMRVPPAGWLNQYAWIIHQTGDNPGINGLGGLGANRLMEYANDGGRVVVFGQDAAAVHGSNNPDGGTFFFGVALNSTWQGDSVSAGAVFTDTAQVLAGVPGSPFDGLTFDVSARGDGAGNQFSIDYFDFGGDGVFDNPLALLHYAQGGGIVAGGYRDQPSVDNPGQAYLGQGLLFGFGLEGVNNDTGHSTRDDLLGAVRAWFTDEMDVQAQPSVQEAYRVSYVQLNAVSTNGGPATLYRVDFGDGSGIFETDEINAQGVATVGHVYTEPGTYMITVEARNGLWTRDVAMVEITVEAGPEYVVPVEDMPMIYLPYTALNAELGGGAEGP